MKNEMTRRQFIKTAGFVSAAMLGAPGILDAAVKAKPNVLFILTDQWRYSALGSSRNRDENVQTPNLDSMAKQGAVFHSCYSAHPLCTPNRAAIITGKFPHETGMVGNDLMLPPDEVCIADLFSKAGYATHYIGKWHMDGADKPGFVPPGWRRRGFKTFEGFNRGHDYYKSPTFTDSGGKMDTKNRYEPGLQTDLAIKFMKKNRANPFFCFLSWGPPHTPYNPPKKYKNIYKPDEIKLRPNVRGKNQLKARKDLANYFGLCTSLDNEFGRLMKAMNEMGIARNTLIVFTADHGDLHYSHGKQFKNQPEEESLHVPLIMRMPATIKPGQEAEGVVSSVDLMPTILSLCGLTVPGTCTGTDKSGYVKQGNNPGDVSVYAERDSQWRAVVRGHYKLVIWGKGKTEGPEQLFDLQKDPYELNNLINESSYTKTLKGLLAEYKIWKKRTNDPFPIKPKRARKMYNNT